MLILVTTHGTARSTPRGCPRVWCRRQDRDLLRHPGQLVRRIHRELPGGRLGGLRRQPRIWPHVGRRSQPVGHIEEAGDGGDVPDVAVAEACRAAAFAVFLFDSATARRSASRRSRAWRVRAATAARRDSSSPSIRRAPDRPKAGAPRRRGRPDNNSSGYATKPRPRSSRARACSGPKAPASDRCTSRRKPRASRVEGIGLEHVGHEAQLFLAFGEIRRHFGRKRPGGRFSAVISVSSPAVAGRRSRGLAAGLRALLVTEVSLLRLRHGRSLPAWRKSCGRPTVDRSAL